jgi:hypothetical protein
MAIWPLTNEDGTLPAVVDLSIRTVAN